MYIYKRVEQFYFETEKVYKTLIIERTSSRIKLERGYIQNVVIFSEKCKCVAENAGSRQGRDRRRACSWPVMDGQACMPSSFAGRPSSRAALGTWLAWRRTLACRTVDAG
jgi:hypothetical protein